MKNQYVEKVVDLTNPEKNIIYNMTVEEAREIVKSGDPEAVRKIDGHFALVSVDGKTEIAVVKTFKYYYMEQEYWQGILAYDVEQPPNFWMVAL